ncbi:hypothetical protein [Blastococcus sp. TF02A-35]|uniref:hypothetical protein n=1 Tax=Blastococcus sp. TF02A-35 TaxID=2559612 RepID=UPI001430806A|nr:hypothetical protein [Blastococcus sp. TF02A_35]
MRRAASGLVAVLLAAGVAAVPTAVSAAPVADLCTVDESRGAVPADFVVDACVDSGAITLRNSLAIPVTVQAHGDIGAAERRVTADEDTAAAVRRLSELLVLAPGDVVRWPRGEGPGELVVGVAGPAPAVPVVGALQPLRARLAAKPDAAERALAALSTDVGAAVAARAACIAGRSAIERVACDLRAADGIGQAVAARVPDAAARAVVDTVLDRGRWSEWSGAVDEMRAALGGAVTLVQEPVVPPPPPPPAPEPAPAPVPAPRAPAPAPQAPAPQVPAPAPAPAAPAPAPAAPAPAPLPLPVPVPVVPKVDPRAELERWLRELAEQARRDWEAARERFEERGHRGGWGG